MLTCGKRLFTWGNCRDTALVHSSLRTISCRMAAAVAASLGTLVLLPGAAGAAFPGVNGVIAYQSTEAGISPCNPFTSSELFAVPSGGGTEQHLPGGLRRAHRPARVRLARRIRGGLRQQPRRGSGAFQLYTRVAASPSRRRGPPMSPTRPAPGRRLSVVGAGVARQSGSDHLPAHAARRCSPALHRERERLRRRPFRSSPRRPGSATPSRSTTRRTPTRSSSSARPRGDLSRSSSTTCRHRRRRR